MEVSILIIFRYASLAFLFCLSLWGLPLLLFTNMGVATVTLGEGSCLSRMESQ